MRMIQTAVVFGILISIPICLLMYFSMDQIGRGARNAAELRDSLEELQVFVSDREHREAEPPIFESELFEHGSATFPISRKIANKEGRTRDVTITGRTRDELQFRTRPDHLNYSYAIKNLSPEDREFALALPLEQIDSWGYPIHRRLTHSDGRTLDTVINGRSEAEIHFRSLRDQRNYKYSIGRLSSADKKLIFTLPITY